MSYYIDKINELYNIPYIPVASFNPEHFYTYALYQNPYDLALTYVAEGNCIDIAELLFKLGATDVEEILHNAIKYGHLSMIEYLYKKWEKCKNYTINDLVILAACRGKIDVYDFLWSKGAYNDYQSLLFAINNERPLLVKHILNKFNFNKQVIIDNLKNRNEMKWAKYLENI